MTFYMVEKEQITTAHVISVNVSETFGAAAWSAATAYVVGNRVSYVATHTIYQCILDHAANANNPSISPTRWIKYSATITWKAFDDRIDDPIAEITGSGYMQYVLGTFQKADTVVLFGVKSPRIDLIIQNSSLVTVSTRTKFLLDDGEVSDYWDYFFSEPYSASECIFRGLNVPDGGRLIIRIYDNPTSGGFGVAPSLGEIIIGKSKFIGETLEGSGRGITDYSRKDRDVFGNLTIVQRSYARRVTFNVFIDPGRTNFIESKLAAMRATPTAFYSYEDATRYGLTVLGIYKDFFIPLTTVDAAFASFEIEGVT